MVFKLVRVDSQEPKKIELSVGKHVIGRGSFLHDDATDKRVSRNHAELEVTDDTVILKSLHHNPCFYIKCSTVSTQLVQQDCSVTLGNGDKFGLIPDHFWYLVLHITDECDQVKENGVQNEIEKSIADNEKILTEKEIKSEANEGERDDPNSSASNQEGTQDYVPAAPPNDVPISPAKRNHSDSDGTLANVKKVKTEPTDDAGSGDAQAGPSNDQVDSDSEDKNSDLPASPPRPSRERCIYGAQCYRRNPQHKAQFSHPQDADWGGGSRGVCPFGHACRRRDPRHWDTHEHPPGVTQPPQLPNDPGPRRKARKVKQDHFSSEEDDDSLAANLIVTGKRIRKTVHRQNDWNGSESEDEDPYKTDESDEWQPSSDMNTQSQSQDFSQD